MLSITTAVERAVDDTRSDRERFAEAFSELRKLGYVARMSCESPPVQSYDAKHVCWYREVDAHAFAKGQRRCDNLIAPLWLHWQGDADEIVRALRAQGLRVDAERMTRPARDTIRVLPLATAPHRFVAKPGALEAGDYQRGCYVCGARAPHPVRRRIRNSGRD